MKVSSFISDVAQRSGQTLKQDLTNGETVQGHLLRAFNLYHQDFNTRNDWPWLNKTIHFQTVLNYSTGTVTVTSGNRAVTVSGGSWTTSMQDRVLKLDRDNEQYEILSVDSGGGQLTLKLPYAGTGGGGLTYKIWKKYYDLDPDVPESGELLMWKWPNRTNFIGRADLDNRFMGVWQNSIPYAYADGGINRSVSTYITGTISTTKGSKIFTGSGTAFLDNIFNGSEVTIGSNIYNVETVDSDTQFTAVQLAVVTVSGSAFSIETKNRRRIILSGVPNPQMNLFIDYYKKTYDLGLDDSPEVFNGHNHVITNVMYGYFLEKLTSDKAFAWLTVYEGQVKESYRTILNKSRQESAIRVGEVVTDRRPSLRG